MTHPFFTKALLVLRGSLRVFKLLFTIVAAIILISTASFLGIYFFFAQDLPDIKTLEDYHPPVISEAYSDDGTRIAEFWLECRIYTPYKDIPKLVIQAFVDSEDARFFDHKGVDMRSIARAFVANLQAGSVTQGGSTITQQITRSLLLTREKSISRKAKEAILATRLERYLNKEQILTLYLNQIYLGNRAYGVAAAARNYYKKPLNELTLAQIALIAGLPTAPTNFSPINNTTEARKRQVHVLERMLDVGHITREEMKKALEEPFSIYVAGTDKDFDDKDAAYFTEHVRRLVKEKYGDDVLYHQGLKIYTTMNIPMQHAAVAAIKKGIEGLDRRLGYRGPLGHIPPGEIANYSKQLEQEIIAKQVGHEIHWPPRQKVENTREIRLETGIVYKAVVSEFSGKDTGVLIGTIPGTIKLASLKWAKPWSPGSIGYEGASYVNDPKSVLKVGDIILVRRLEDGSYELAQDPLIQSALVSLDTHNRYIKAMVGGYDFAKSEFNRATQALRQPGSSFKPYVYAAALDKGYTFSTNVADSPISFHVGQEVWTPKNYGGNFNGNMTFRNCLQFSRNVPTAKITYDIGTHYITGYQRKLGISSPIEKFLSMSLGSNVVYLLDMVQAYSTFADEGRFRHAVAILKIEDEKGNVLEAIDTGRTEVNETEELLGKEYVENLKKKQKGDSEAEKEGNSAEASEGVIPIPVGPADFGKSLLYEELDPELVDIARAAIKNDKLNLTDQEIRTLFGSSIPPGHVMTPQTAYLMVTMLKGVVEGGTGTRVKALGKPAAGKTGTTNDETDAWFIGFVPDLAAGVWVGFDEVQKIGQGVAGGNTAAPIFLDYMKVATEGWEAKDFTKPADFPEGDINNLTGGSSLYGQARKMNLPGDGGIGIPGSGSAPSDRAGKFFDEDFEELH